MDIRTALLKASLAAGTGDHHDTTPTFTPGKGVSSCPSQSKFKQQAKKELLERQYGSRLNHIDTLIHRANDEFCYYDDERRHLVWLLNQVKEALTALPSGQHEDYLSGAFRRSDPIITLGDYRQKLGHIASNARLRPR